MARAIVFSFFALFLALAPSAALAEGFGALLNKWRGAQALAPMARSAALERAAERHARDMARRGYFSHKSPNGASVKDRARRAGYRACLFAENIAKGQRSEDEVMRDWVNSRGHRRNMALGQALHYGYAAGRNNIHVLVLARPC